MEDLKGRTIGVYAAGDICDAWEQAAKKEDIPVARWGARAIKEKLEKEGLLPEQLPQEPAWVSVGRLLEENGLSPMGVLVRLAESQKLLNQNGG